MVKHIQYVIHIIQLTTNPLMELNNINDINNFCQIFQSIVCNAEAGQAPQYRSLLQSSFGTQSDWFNSIKSKTLNTLQVKVEKEIIADEQLVSEDENQNQQPPRNNSSAQVSGGQKTQCQFHNFQKHLVTTIRYAAKTSKIRFEGATNLPKKMWDQFVKCKQFNKALLHILFGQYDDNNQRQHQTFTKFHYAHFTDKYTSGRIRQAQRFLRESFVQQMKAINWEQFMNSRRMKKKSQFIHYLKEFIKELEQGPLGKRISRQTIANLEENFKQIQAQQSNTDPSRLSLQKKQNKQ